MKTKTILSIALIALLLAACGGQATPSEPTPDVAAVRTSAASTVVSQFTLTAAVFTPTTPVEPTETPAPEEAATEAPTQEAAVIEAATGTEEGLCDLLSYDVSSVDVNIPDNTIMTPGQDFVKTWKVKNNGTCPWGAGYALTFTGTGTKMDGQFIAFTEVIQPGQEVEVSVQFKAPAQAGNYVSTWTMTNPRGVSFPEAIYVKIIVQ